MENLLSEAFQRLSLLEQDFDFSTVDKDRADELSAFIADDIEEIPEEPIIDVNAENEEDLADNYVGKVIIECECCHSRLYKNEDDVIIDEEAGLANVDEPCPVCNNSLGYSVIGKIEAFDSDRKIEPEDNEEDVPDVDADVEDDLGLDADAEPKEDEEEKDESLKNSKIASDDSKQLDEALPLEDRLARKHFDSLLADDVEEGLLGTAAAVGAGALLGSALSNKNESKIGTAINKGGNKVAKVAHGIGDAAQSVADAFNDDVDEKLDATETARMAEITKNGVVRAADREEYNDLHKKELEEADASAYFPGDEEYVNQVNDYLETHPYDLDSGMDEEDIAAEICSNLFDRDYYSDDCEPEIAHSCYSAVCDYFDNQVNEELLDHGNDNLEASDKLATKDTKSLEDDQKELVHAAGDKIAPINEAADGSYDNKFDKDFDDAVDALDKDDDFTKSFPDDLPNVWGKVDESCNDGLNESVEIHTDGEPVDLVKNDDGSLSVEVAGNPVETAEDAIEAPAEEVGAEEIVPLNAEDQASIEANEPEGEDLFDEPIEDELAEPLEDEFAEEPEEETGEFESLQSENKPAINEAKDPQISDQIAKEQLKQMKIQTKMLKMDLEAKKAEMAPVEEVAEPVEDVIEEPIEDEVEDSAEEVVEESLEGNNLLENITDVDETKLNKIFESFLRRVYSNVDTFNVSNVKMTNNTAVVEGVINFTSGKTKNTAFNFANPSISKRGKLVLEGFNSTFTKSDKAFTMKCKLDNTNLVAESMIYNYTVSQLNESNNQEVVRVYGRVKA